MSSTNFTKKLLVYLSENNYPLINRTATFRDRFDQLSVVDFFCLFTFLAKGQLLKEGKCVVGHPEPYVRATDKVLGRSRVLVNDEEKKAIQKIILGWQTELIEPPWMNPKRLEDNMQTCQQYRIKLLKAALNAVLTPLPEMTTTTRPSRLSMASTIPDTFVENLEKSGSSDYTADSGCGQELETYFVDCQLL